MARRTHIDFKREETTTVVVRRCLCKKHYGRLTKRELLRGHADNQTCTDCGTTAYGSVVIDARDYDGYEPNYDKKASKEIGKMILGDTPSLTIKLHDSIANSFSEAMVNRRKGGFFVFSHFHFGRNGATSSNWLNKSEYESDFNSNSSEYIRMFRPYNIPNGLVVEAIVQKSLTGSEIVPGTTSFVELDYFPKGPISVETDLVLSEEVPIEIFSVPCLDKIEWPRLEKKLDQMTLQTHALDSTCSLLLILESTKSDAPRFALLSIDSDGLINRSKSILDNIIDDSMYHTVEECEMMNGLTDAMMEEIERTNFEGATVLLFGEDCDWEGVLFG